jgi:hypothetical protein
MTKAEEILEKHLAIMDAETMIGKHGRTHKAVINAINEAINYTHSCTELRDKEPTLVYNGRDRFGKEIWLNKDKT